MAEVPTSFSLGLEPPVQKSFSREGDSGPNEDKYEPPPEESIPDLPENAAARDFLKSAPSKGLWMPLGKEVKVMQCWRCKAYGHRTGDKECPLSQSGNIMLDVERQVREDPMCQKLALKKESRNEKYARVELLMKLVDEIRKEEKKRKRKKEEEKKPKKKKKKKHRQSDDK